MSTSPTPNSETVSDTERPSAGPIGSESELEGLVAETVAFVATFERWSGRRAVEAGGSVPRLKLLYSIHCNGPRKMADLAGELETTPRNVTAIVDGLEAEGLVRRTSHATDRRVTLIELTCKRDEVAEQFARYQRSVGELFAGLEASDRETLERLLPILRMRMRQTERRPAEARR